MQITLKMRSPGKQSAVDAVRETIEAVRAGLADAADVSEVFPGVTTGDRAGMVTLRLDTAPAAEADAVLQALEAATTWCTRSARSREVRADAPAYGCYCSSAGGLTQVREL